MRLIDADELKRRILEERDKIPLTIVERYIFGVGTPNRHGQSMRGGIRKALRCMEETPTLEMKPVVRGHWDENVYPPVCSECRMPALSEKKNLRVVDRCYDFDGIHRPYKSVDYDTVYRKTAFCPNCGVDMSED